MDTKMRINEELLQTVAFIGSRQSDGAFQANATGFLCVSPRIIPIWLQRNMWYNISRDSPV